MEGGPSHFPQGFSCPVVLWILLCASEFRLRVFHPLWTAFPKPFGYSFAITFAVLNPEMLAFRFGLFPFRSPLLWKSIWISPFSFSSSGYLDVSVRRVPFHTLWIGVWIHGMLHVGFPIQTSPARWVFAPPRSFSQLITSFIGSQCLRHPPYALCILTLAAVKISLNSISSLIFSCLQHLA